MKIGHFVAVLATLVTLVIAGCGQSQPQLPPGYVMGPNGVPVPAAGMPGMPGTAGMPGMPGMPGTAMMPGMPGMPATAAAPDPNAGVQPTAGSTAPTIGVPECDAYAARACNCNNEAARAASCQAATMSMQTWQTAIQASPVARDAIAQGCTTAEQALRATCTQ